MPDRDNLDSALGKIRSKFNELTQPVRNVFQARPKFQAPTIFRKAASNLRGNVQALSNSDSRGDWFKGFQPKSYTDFKRGVNSMGTDLRLKRRKIGSQVGSYLNTERKEFDNFLESTSREGVYLPPTDSIGNAYPQIPNTIEKVVRTPFNLGGRLFGVQPQDNKVSDFFGTLSRGFVESPAEYKTIREKMFRNEPLTESEREMAQNEQMMFFMGAIDAPKVKGSILPKGTNPFKNVVEDAKNSFKSFIDNTPFSPSKATKADSRWTQKVKVPNNMRADEFVQEMRKANFSEKNRAKVNILDYLRTPDRVLKKLGLEDEAKLLIKKQRDYLVELPQELNKVNQWYEQVKDIPNSSRRIFRHLDGSKLDSPLTPPEAKVADEIKAYYKEWADKLNLPQESRITDYITHIFDDQLIQRDFDPDLAKLIADKVPGSVYSPFTQERLGAKGYIEDTWKALDAYIKRGTRKYHMDQALEQLQTKSKDLDIESWNFVKNYADRINLRPTEFDNLLDNLIKQTPIEYRLGSRPFANISRSVRQQTYRATLGLNIKSALKNLSQTNNTFAKMGFKDTGAGFVRAIKDLVTGADELERVGVLSNNFVQDRSYSVKKKAIEKMDRVLFYLFDTAERINRGAAYYAGKRRALKQGKTEAEAIEAGIELARNTNFEFSPVDTPLALSSDGAKTLGQFMSYPIKQTEFVAEMISNKEWAALARYIAGTIVIVKTVGDTLGLDYSDSLPVYDVATGETKLGEPPPIKLVKEFISALVGAPDEFGNEADPNLANRLFKNSDLQRAVGTTTIPGFVQGRNTWQGIEAYNQGYSAADSGRVRFPVNQDAGSFARSALFGQYSSPEAREYFDNKRKPLGEKQSEVFKSISDPQQRKDYYKLVNEKRGLDDTAKKLEKKAGKFSPASTPELREAQKELISEKMSSDVPLTNEELEFYYLEDYNALPTDNEYDEAVKKAESYTTAAKALKDERLSADQKAYLYTKLGVSKPEIEYYSASNLSVNEKTSYVLKQFQKMGSSLDKKALLAFLVRGRREINGEVFISKGVLENLRNEGYITEAEYKRINKIKLNADGSYTPKASKRGRKGRKPKIMSVPRLKLPKTQPARMPSLNTLLPSAQRFQFKKREPLAYRPN